MGCNPTDHESRCGSGEKDSPSGCATLLLWPSGRNFTTSSLSFLLIALNSLVTLIAFIGVLWMISGKLVVMLVVYAVAGTAISIMIGRKLVRLHYHQYEKEANFRYGLVRARDNAESIAFYRGEKREHLDLFNRLASAVGNMRLIIIRNRRLGFFTNSYNYLALVLPVLIVAPMFMRGQVEFGVVTQAAGAFAQVLAAVSLRGGRQPARPVALSVSRPRCP